MTVNNDCRGHQGEREGQTIAAIPAFNEARSISRVVASARRHVDTVLVIDDGSADETSQRAESAGAVVLKHESNQGKAAGIVTAFTWARERSARAVVLIDGDGQHDPEDIPRLLAPVVSGEADVVVGSRFLDIKNPIPYYRTIGQRVLNIVTHFGSGQHCSDSQCGFRAFSAVAIRVIQLRERFLHGLAVESEMQFEISDHRLRICEIPIYVRYDERARRSPIKHGFGVLYRVLVMTVHRRPRVQYGLSAAASVLAVTLLMLIGRVG